MSKNTCFCALLVLICAHRLSERIKSFEIWTQYSSQCGNYFCFLVRADSIWSSPLKSTKTLNSSWCSWWCSSRSTGGVGGSPKKNFFFQICFFLKNHIKNVFNFFFFQLNPTEVGPDLWNFCKSKTIFCIFLLKKLYIILIARSRGPFRIADSHVTC